MTEKSKDNKQKKSKLSPIQKKMLIGCGRNSAPFIVLIIVLDLVLKLHLHPLVLIGLCVLVIAGSYLILWFSLRNNTFIAAMEVLQKEGYSDNYMEKMRKEISKAEKHMKLRNAAGFSAMLGFAMFFRGELSEAYDQLKSINFNMLRKPVRANYVNNLICICFFLGKYDEAMSLFDEHQKVIFSDTGALMKRTLGIREYIRERYENAVTIFIKLMESESKSDSLFSDICLIKTMMELDMYESSRPFLKFLEGYKGKGELETIASDLKRCALAGLDSTSSGKKKKKSKK